MESLTEEHLKALLGRPWLTKVDAIKSTAYLFKFCAFTTDVSCVLLITDTKSVWAEALNSNQIARRWRVCNGLDASLHHSDENEDAWRRNSLENLAKVHSLGGVTDLDFEVMDSHYSDLAIEMECDVFKWRWETCFIGYKASAEVISKQLVLPLISINHLTVNSGEAVGKMSETELEKAIDRVGQTARHDLDTHIRTAISKPRVATSICRMTAVANKVPDLPAVCSAVESPSLQAHPAPPSNPVPESVKSRSVSPGSMLAEKEESVPEVRMASPEQRTSITAAEPMNEDSETEDDEEEVIPLAKGKARASVASRPPASSRPKSPSPILASKADASAKTPTSDTDGSPPPSRPAKKLKASSPASSSSSSSDDSDAESKRRNVQGDGVKRGTRQPIKRGGKRF